MHRIEVAIVHSQPISTNIIRRREQGFLDQACPARCFPDREPNRPTDGVGRSRRILTTRQEPPS
jgi:hypothetical protein